MKLCIVLLAFVGIAAQAQPKVISQETRSLNIASLGAVNADCRPGVAPNGHNYPTPSSLQLNLIQVVMPTANTQEVGVLDPQNRVGDFCNQLMNETQALLPADLTVIRTLSEDNQYRAGNCVRVITENLEAHLKDLTFRGESSFVEETLPAAQCGQ